MAYTRDQRLVMGRKLVSDGAPTTQFDGVAPKGMLCVDTTNGDLYINQGTKADNTWVLVGPPAA